MPLVALAISLGFAAGCCERPYYPGQIADSSSRGQVVLLPGVLGYYGSVCEVADALEMTTNCSVQIWDWTAIRKSGAPWLLERAAENLSDESKNRWRAKKLAEVLVKWRQRNPDKQLYIVATSGGAGIAGWACKYLPKDFQLQKLVLLSPAISPEFDLVPALTHSKDGVYSYYSKNDCILQFDRDCFLVQQGSRRVMDRRDGDGAGFSGFGRGSCGEECHELYELAWDPSMRLLGNNGKHFGNMSTSFQREYVATMLVPGQNDKRWVVRHSKPR